jgi:two-component system, chemotaxis family, protein-glutamate methylesterase/glutaminase
MNTKLGRKIRVLIVDDSAIVRKILSEALSGQPDIEVVGTAPDPYIARDKILSLHPDVLTLDIEMPRMSGLAFLEKLSRFHPMPVIIISSVAQSSCEAALEALRLGAVHVLAKPGGPYSVEELRLSLADNVRSAAASRCHVSGSRQALPPPAPAKADKITQLASVPGDVIVAIGASTGGTEAIREVLVQLPADSPPMVITQHIPAVFSTAFANRLNKLCSIEVKEAADGDVLQPGRALIAPGDFHMFIRKNGNGYRAAVKTGPRVCYQRPSADVLFESVATAAGRAAIGVLLTGMGSDGAQGLLKMKQAGAWTIAQDEESCVVFGMPREAIRLGAVDQIVGLSEIANFIMKALRAQHARAEP